MQPPFLYDHSGFRSCFFFFLVSRLPGIPCAQQHFARHRSCPKCGLPVQSEAEVRSVDFSATWSLFGASPQEALAAAHETAVLWAHQTKLQDDRRKEKCARELAELQQQLAAERQQNHDLRASKVHLTDLVEKLRSAQPEAAAPVRDGGLTPTSALRSSKSFAVRAKSTFPTTRPVRLHMDMDSPGAPMSKERINVYLVRHGESEANVDPSVLLRLSDHVVPLSALGKEQATAAGRFLKNELSEKGCRVLVSPYKRARDTADLLVQQCEHAFRDVCENIFLGEQQFGLFEGISLDAIREDFPREHAHFEKAIAHGGRFYARMPLGESRFDVVSRVCRVIDSIVADEHYCGIRTVVVVAHGITLRAFAMAWLARTHEWFEQQPNPNNCSVRLLRGNQDCGYIFPGFLPERRKGQPAGAPDASHGDKEQDLVSALSQISSVSESVVDVSKEALQQRLDKLMEEAQQIKQELSKLK